MDLLKKTLKYLAQRASALNKKSNKQFIGPRPIDH